DVLREDLPPGELGCFAADLPLHPGRALGVLLRIVALADGIPPLLPVRKGVEVLAGDCMQGIAGLLAEDLFALLRSDLLEEAEERLYRAAMADLPQRGQRRADDRFARGGQAFPQEVCRTRCTHLAQDIGEENAAGLHRHLRLLLEETH